MSQARTLLVTSEAVPLVKTGGLADVIGALAATLTTRGVDTSILMPGYPAAIRGAIGLKKICALPDLPGGDGELLQGKMPGTGVTVLLLRSARFENRTANPYVDQSGHEYEDNALAFGDLCHAAVRICAGKTPLTAPHVVHANDWHAGLIAALMRVQKIEQVGTALTIHNLAFQGNYSADLAPQLGIPADMINEEGMEFWGKLSFLKAGVSYSDRITTVSHTYAREILTPRFGYGFEGVLNRRKDALRAIPNGVDVECWNPATDKLIKRNFSIDNMAGKAACKRDLQKLFDLPVQQFTPLMAIGSRITHQKMADVILEAMPGILERHPQLQVAVLGCGESQYAQAFEALAAQHQDRVGVYIGYDERRAHALHAGADILLHPTRFEPFGLTPLYSMLYGTIPVSSRVGGLCDTIHDAASSRPDPCANGILFDGETTEDLSHAVERAVDLYMRPVAWQAMQRNAMQGDFSWQGPAEAYIRMYAEIAPASAKAAFLAVLKPKASETLEPMIPSPAHYKMTA
jgi:starch synthase